MTPKPSEAELAAAAAYHAADELSDRRTLLESLAELRKRSASWYSAARTLARFRRAERARAEAAEKRVAELTARLEMAIERGGTLLARARSAEAKLEAAVDFIATGDFTDDARRQAIAKAETALAGAEAGERKPVPATEHYSGECPTCGNACRCAGCKEAP